MKTTLESFAYFQAGTRIESKVLGFVSHIGKWSMANVFVAAIFLAVTLDR
jgi:uncharacterized paraquat-inducible protein A